MYDLIMTFSGNSSVVLQGLDMYTCTQIAIHETYIANGLYVFTCSVAL